MGSRVFLSDTECVVKTEYGGARRAGDGRPRGAGRQHASVTAISADKCGNRLRKSRVLPWGADSGIVSETTFAEDLNDDIAKKADAILARESGIRQVLDDLPGEFGAALTRLMERTGTSVETLAEKALISAKLVQRMRNDPAYPKNIDCVVAVCVGMHLPPELSHTLLERGGFSLQYPRSEKQQLYKFFIDHYYTHSLYECNDLLAASGLPPMTGTE